MRYTHRKATGKLGVSYVEGIVAKHGSVFRPVHEEDDIGIDGFIELVRDENASGHLIAVQIKSGESFRAPSGDEFVVAVDEKHLNYWLDFIVPVILVCYLPSEHKAAWVSVRDYVENEKYHNRLPVTQIRVPMYRAFDLKALSKEIAALAHVRSDERILLRSADLCLSPDPQLRQQGFQVLTNHPDSRGLKITCLLARQFLGDHNAEMAKDALFILGYGVGRARWSGNPMNRDEHEVIGYACDLCRDLSESEIYHLLCLCDGEAFHGPQGLGERLLDVIGCCFETAERVLDRVSADQKEPMERRANALYLLFQCDDAELEDAKTELMADTRVRDVAKWLLGADLATSDDAAPESST